MSEACIDYVRIPLLAGAHLAQAADFLAERFESADENGAPDGGPPLTWRAQLTEQTGTACKSAADPATCKASLDALRLLPTDATACFAQGPGGGPSRGCFTRYLVTTRGDQIATAQGAAQVKALFGTIDTPEEALYLAQVSGYTVTCADAPLAQYRTERSGYRLVVQKRDGTCDEGITQVVLSVSSDGTLQELSSVRVRPTQPCSVGRRPQGLEPAASSSSASSLGDFFAQAAHLEAASVHAFRYLHEELTELGAPEALLARVEQARRDEVRHARTTARLARRFGGTVARARVRPRAPRSILEMALENATEGCVGETYGAVVASYQALTAEDAEVRAAMLRIAQDETAHAQLSWDLLAFYAERLTPEECAEVEAARARAIASLRHDLAVEPTLALRTAAGLPPAAVAQRLLDETHALLAA